MEFLDYEIPHIITDASSSFDSSESENAEEDPTGIVGMIIEIRVPLHNIDWLNVAHVHPRFLARYSYFSDTTLSSDESDDSISTCSPSSGGTNDSSIFIDSRGRLAARI